MLFGLQSHAKRLGDGEPKVDNVNGVLRHPLRRVAYLPGDVVSVSVGVVRHEDLHPLVFVGYREKGASRLRGVTLAGHDRYVVAFHKAGFLKKRKLPLLLDVQELVEEVLWEPVGLAPPGPNVHRLTAVGLRETPTRFE